MASFGSDLAELIFKHHPKAMQGDAEALGKVTGAMATTFGGLLAMSLRLHGKERTEQAILVIVRLMLEQGGIIGDRAEQILRERKTKAN
jgi:hypothetical protein